MKVTESAKNKVSELIEAPNQVISEHKFFLRVTAVEDDGIKYQTYFDFETRLNDRLFRFKDFDLRVDEESLLYLESATLDYNEEQGFLLDGIEMVK